MVSEGCSHSIQGGGYRDEELHFLEVNHVDGVITITEKQGIFVETSAGANVERQKDVFGKADLSGSLQSRMTLECATSARDLGNKIESIIHV